MESYPSTAFYFKLIFQDEKICFQELSGLTKEMSIEEITEGGENHYKYKLPSQPKPVNLVLKRGIMPENSKLSAWCTNALNGGLAGSIETFNVSITIVDTNDVAIQKWLIYDAYPVKFLLAGLISQENNIAFEFIELAYKYQKKTD